MSTLPDFIKRKAQRALAERRSDHTLPQQFYVDADLLEVDLAAVFHRQWLQVALEIELPRPGDYVTLNVGRSPIILVRNSEGQVSGLFNTCRHRGAQICQEERGHLTSLICPYHQWRYDLRGRLLRAPDMPADFDLSAHGLRPIQVETVGGLIYVCLSRSAPDFGMLRQALGPLLEPYELHKTKLAHTVVLREHANWKLVMENARECYHCRARHPEFMRAMGGIAQSDFHRQFAQPHAGTSENSLQKLWDRWEAKGLPSRPIEFTGFKAGRLPFNAGAVSVTVDGKPAVKQRLGRIPDYDVGSLRLALEPNTFSHVFGDYAFFFQALPVAPQETIVVAKWVVHQDAVEGVDYDLRRLVEVWDVTNQQDKWLVENNQMGVNSVGYVQGPYAQQSETWLIDFVNWYCDTLDGYFRCLEAPSDEMRQ